ncbi:hypothetical protein [Yoonia maritima]|uniref:hypothetical protein n=1 Tax=Yoonia maritima TaxID=1435347 RepID=UPI0013A65C16|nr:hypothetical protein [Yoonia maritima]
MKSVVLFLSHQVNLPSFRDEKHGFFRQRFSGGNLAAVYSVRSPLGETADRMNPPPAEKRCLKQGTPPCTAGVTIKMNIATPLALKPTLPHQQAVFPIHGFIELNRDALHHAARLLGGCDGAHTVDQISDALSRELAPSRRTSDLLKQLRDILFLEHVDDPDRVESGFFAAIDPANPVVEDICLLADGLAQALRNSPTVSGLAGRAIDGNGTQGPHYCAGVQKLGDLK